MPREFTRPPEGFPFAYGGLSTNNRADMMVPTKYPVAVNIRSYTNNQIRTRPGIVRQFDAGSTSSTDFRAYTGVLTDDLPRILVRDILDHIWLDNGVQVGSLVHGAIGILGATFIPFRPGASPQPWMYIANGSDYQKFSSPSATNVVTQQKVGIAEPQIQPEAYATDNDGLGANVIYQTHGTPAFTAGGTAGATVSGNRTTDTVVASFVDPAYTGAIGFAPNNSLQVSSAGYTRGQMLKIGSTFLRVVDVFPALATTVSILSIYYFTGSTGRCLIVPNNISAEPSGDQSIYGETWLTSLRRGALIQIASEVCLVWSVTFGPDSSVTIETSTVGAHSTADALTTVNTVVVANSASNLTGSGITSNDDTSAVTTGIGTLTATISPNPFITSSTAYQSDDYFHISINVDNLANLVEAKLLLDIGDGSFTQNFFYYTLRPADITTAVLNTVTQLAAQQTVAQRAIVDELTAISSNNQGETWSSSQSPAGSTQWAELHIPINNLTRVGSDTTKSLQTLTKLQILINASGTVNIAFNGIYVSGGYQVDVGEIGAPILYRYRGRSSLTGAKSNPSPATRYGTSPRRQANYVTIPNVGSPYDAQIDTWDIFRFGGTVTQWRFAGSILAQNGQVFVDNYDDASIQAGDALDFDNFEPWPSIDLPFTNQQVTGGAGTAILVNVPTPGNVARYLPGTLAQFPGSGNNNVYTLRRRPVLITGSTWRFEFVESVGQPVGFMYIYEPDLANQQLPFLWGPDVNGTIFACGDPLRAGTLYFSKGNDPDSAPDSYNIEIVPPSEPLQGGEVVDGLSYVASTERWWALYPQPDNPTQRYNFVQTDDTRGLAAPFAHCTDGKARYWFARDGIYSSMEGSLTDADLFNLFPHDGVPGEVVVYNGITLHPPAYARAIEFRLSYANGFLYATYVYIGGGDVSIYVTLVCNLRTKAWSVDLYGGTEGIQNVYQIEQKPGSSFAPNPVVLMLGTQGASSISTRVYVQTDFSNDNGVPINCNISTFEFDGGDKRAPKQWGDVFLDCLPASSGGIAATPVSLGAGVAPLTTVPQSSSRTRVPISVGGIVISDFLGLFLGWTDNFPQSSPTVIYLWQPSLDVQPARELSWTSFGSSFGLKGYMHLRQIDIAWVSTQPVTITAVPFDGQAPVPIVVPSSGGVYKKVLFPFSANKGLLYSFTVSSPAPFQIFNDDTELYVGEWGRQEGYQVFRGFGGRTVDDAPI